MNTLCRGWVSALLLVAPVATLAATTIDFESGAIPPEITLSSSNPWRIDTSDAFGGIRSLRNGPVSANGASTVMLTVTVTEPSVIEYAFRFESPSSSPFFQYSLDGGALAAYESSNGRWRSQSHEIAPGTHTLTWRLGTRVTGISDALVAALDDVRVVPLIDATRAAPIALQATEASWGRSAGLLGLDLHDHDDDGRLDVFAGATTGGHGYWYIARWRDSRLEKVHVSGALPGMVNSLDVFREANGSSALAVSFGSRIRVYRLPDLSVAREFSILHVPRKIEVADLDGDGRPELVTLTADYGYSTVAAYDAASGVHHWTHHTQDESRGFAIADLSAAPGLEIAVARSPGTLLSATGTVLWAYAFGFGTGDITAGNFDADSDTEFVGMGRHSDVQMFDARLESPLWALPVFGHLYDVAAFDLDGNSVDELLVSHSGGTEIYSTSTLQPVVEIAAALLSDSRFGDLDGDGLSELVTAWEDDYNGDVALRVVDPRSGAQRWIERPDLAPLPAVRVADFDADGRLELVYATPRDFAQRSSGRLHALDLATFDEERVSEPFAGGRDWLGAGGFDVAQLDGDAALELFVATASIRDCMFEVYDGATFALERATTPTRSCDRWRYPRLLDQNRALVLAGSRLAEIVIADGTTAWSLPNPDVRQFDVQDTDSDGSREIVLLTATELVVVDLATRNVLWSAALPYGPAGLSVDPVRREIYVGAANEIRVFDAVARRRVRSHPTLDPVTGVWHARTSTGTPLAFASTARTVAFQPSVYAIEAFDSLVGARLDRTLSILPHLGAIAGSLPHRTRGRSITIWGHSGYGVHQIALDIPDPAILFQDDFE